MALRRTSMRLNFSALKLFWNHILYIIVWKKHLCILLNIAHEITLYLGDELVLQIVAFGMRWIVDAFVVAPSSSYPCNASLCNLSQIQ